MSLVVAIKECFWYTCLMMANQIPQDVQKYFWGDDLGDLNLKEHQKYIVQTLLQKGDETAISWLFSQVSNIEIKKLLPKLKLDKKSAIFWSNYFEVSQEKILCLQTPYLQALPNSWKN